MSKLDEIHRIVGTLEERTRGLPELTKRVNKVEEQQAKQKSFVRGVKWVVGLFVVSFTSACSVIGLNPEKTAIIIKKFLLLH